MIIDRNYLSVPHNCYIILTSMCNMRCLHCYGDYNALTANNELTGDQWVRIFKDLAKNNIFYLNISGGEPTTHPDFEMIIESLAKNELYFMLTTNGVCNDSKIKSILKTKDYILGIQVSLDGPNWKSHGFLRKDIFDDSKKILFDKAFSSAEIFIKNKIRTSIATCIHRNNISKIGEMKEFILNLKPNNWSLSTISLSGRAKNNNEIFASESELPISFWRQLKKDCEMNNIKVDFVDMPSLLKTKKGGKVYYQCPAAKWFCEINSDGTTTPCPLTRINPPSKGITFDNILKKSISEIWNGKAFDVFRYYQKNGCEGCNIKDKCNRCPPQSIQWFNDALMPPPYCIYNGKSLGLKNLNKLKEKLKSAMKKNSRENFI